MPGDPPETSPPPAATWARDLVDHVASLAIGEDRPLVVVVDVETALVDQRLAVGHALRWYDRARGTAFAVGFRPERVPEPVRLDDVLGRLPMPGPHRAAAADFLREQLWHPETVIEAGGPYRDTMEVVRRLQLHRTAQVALTSSRSERLRWETLHGLDALAAHHHTGFRYDLLFMNEFGAVETLRRSKVIARERLEAAGYVVAAVVDGTDGGRTDEEEVLYVPGPVSSRPTPSPESLDVAS